MESAARVALLAAPRRVVAARERHEAAARVGRRPIKGGEVPEEGAGVGDGVGRVAEVGAPRRDDPRQRVGRLRQS